MKIFVYSQWLVTVPLTALFVFWLGLPVFWVFSIQLIEELVKFPAFHLRLRAGDWKHGQPQDA